MTVLALNDISKSFGATQALRSISLEFRPGEVHAIVGENGAGKSTLINILSGVLQPNAGEILMDRTPVKFGSAQIAQKLGVSTVHQELSLSENLTVAENIFAGRPAKRLGFVNWKQVHSDADRLLRSLGMLTSSRAIVSELPISGRQIVEIAKAVSLKPKILLLDEPTSALNHSEKENLFELVKKLRASGLAIIFISHHLDEVLFLSDRVSVLRDGQSVGTWPISQVSAAMLVSKMVGRDVSEALSPTAPKHRDRVLMIEQMTSEPKFRNISFSLKSGEIVALAGLMGSGRSALAQTVAGLGVGRSNKVVGSMTWRGVAGRFSTLRQAMRRGIGYIPADRKTGGLFLDLPVSENVLAANLERASQFGIFRDRIAARIASDFAERLRIKTRSPNEKSRNLSGGNQQKVLLAKWLLREPQLLIIEEPSRGVDVAAKLEIHKTLNNLAEGGTAILFVSSDLPEILSLSHRVLVMRNGNLVADLDTSRTSEEEIVSYASGVSESAA